MSDFNQEASTWDAKPMRIERAQAVAHAIRSSLPLTPHTTALEYGCGTGLLSFALQAQVGHPRLEQITLVDSSPGMLAVLDQKIASLGIPPGSMLPFQADFITDPLPPLRVQLIYTLMTLHHISDTDRILRAFYSLLEAPGWLCVADLDAEDGSFHGPEDLTVHKGFDRAALAALAVRAGFAPPTFTTVYQVPRAVNGVTRLFPLFLMIAKK
jgi:ubiquinone/menaquinone biosynthesis C-methylase UbiE